MATLFQQQNMEQLGQDDPMDLLNEGFPAHESRKQALFKLVTQQITKARTILDFRLLRPSPIHQRGLNLATNVDETIVDSPPPLDPQQGDGDTETEKEATAAPVTSKMDEVGETTKAKLSSSPAKPTEVAEPEPQSQPQPSQDKEEEKLPDHVNDEYKQVLSQVLDCLLEDLGIPPFYQEPEVAKEEEEAHATPAKQVPFVSALLGLLLSISIFAGLNWVLVRYYDTVAWPWYLCDRLMNLTLIPDFVRKIQDNAPHVKYYAKK